VLPIYEPGLDTLVERNRNRGTLRFSTDLRTAVQRAQVAFIAVGTPPREDGSADLSAVYAVADAIGPSLAGYTVVVNKSTVPLGTWATVRDRIAARAEHPFSVASNPEFLKEGDAVNDFMKPSRVIIGTSDAQARAILGRLYAPFTKTNDRLHFMDPASAELCKYACNAMLAVRISFMNELAQLAECVGADVEQVRRGLGSDPRIGPKFLYPGCGYGGSCFPKDLKALLHTAALKQVPLEVVDAAERANARQKSVLARKVRAHFGDGASPLAGKTIGVWGLAFKPGTDDIRESPAIDLIEGLLAAGARVQAYDPAAVDNARAHFGERVLFPPGMYHAAEGADALALVTEWHEFRRPDFARLAGLMNKPIVFDGRNVLDPDEVRGLGFTYYGIGRP
jgi:UDPglucose 6-dehydrogenase